MMPASSCIKVLDPRQSYTKTFFQKKKKKTKKSRLQETEEEIQGQDKIKKEEKQKRLQYGISNQY